MAEISPYISSQWCVIEKTSLGENIYSPNGNLKEPLSHWLFPYHKKECHCLYSVNLAILGLQDKMELCFWFQTPPK